MIYQIFRALENISPGLRSLMFRIWYNYLAGLPFASELLFMNYGFIPGVWKYPRPDLAAADEVHRLCIQLYHHNVHSTPLAGKKVLEVGCGRGGGCSYLARYHQPAAMTGVDFTPRVIRFCNRHHRLANLTFTRANAMALPFADKTFAAVINVESSHCYTSFAAFAGEVYRVLEPGGIFCITDLREPELVPELKSSLLDAGFRFTEEEIITADVLRAMETDHDRKAELIKTKTPGFLHEPLMQFAGTRVSHVYNRMKAGEYLYFRYKLEKPEQGGN